MTERSGAMAMPSASLLASLVGKEDELRDTCCKTYFGRMVVAFTTANSLKYYTAFPWNFAIRDGNGWRQFHGIPNKVETRARALRRAWHRAKWLHDGTWDQHYDQTQGRLPRKEKAMKNTIEKGDRVKVTFGQGGYFDDIEGVVDYTPCAEGDSWVLVQDDGRVIYVQRFETMILLSKLNPESKV